MPGMTRKVIKFGTSKGIIIPAAVCEMLDFEIGTYVRMELVGKQLIIKKSKEGRNEGKR